MNTRQKKIEALFGFLDSLNEPPKTWIVWVKDGKEICEEEGYPDQVKENDNVILLTREKWETALKIANEIEVP